LVPSRYALRIGEIDVLVVFLWFEGSRLTIKTPLIKNPYTGQQTVSTLVFERSK
jgi:hypothetical protein